MADKLIRDERDHSAIHKIVDTLDSAHALRIVNAASQPEFYLNRQFRALLEFSSQNGNAIPVGQRILIRAVLGVNTLLQLAAISVDSGAVRVRSLVGGTPTGVFGVTMTSIRANGMSVAPTYTSVNAFTATAPGLPAAVDISGATVSDVIRARSANQNVSTASVNSTAEAERGLPAGTVYILLENISSTDPAEGTIRFRWTEMP